ncbi:LamG-like jellyroll fold domain-containing protein [Hyalangium rubrum]|uniref:LamG-like jellyroll fold domain-containing protein n=1 Tax=Hyalangium rubrum TaxID=3103134 RepID=A0ABU5GZE8_9BACT|nr:LamG-like jellyroll fold domain-containing protein [Hyalangium sp. s54d21]MDY7226436.1 LamG-like jellyroll fold domain-containing protein [Hyalangium sp. s54d21]
MPRSFAITTSAPSLQLNGTGRGEFTFTVSNTLARPVRVRAVLEPEGSLPRGWLMIEGETERELAPDGTQSYGVKLLVPPGTPEGSYAFRLIIADVANPDEEFAIGPLVNFQLQRPAPVVPKKKFPLWIALLAAGVLLITAGAITAGVLLRDDEEPGLGGSGSEPTVFLRFDGQNDYVDLGDPPALTFPGTVTMEAWIRPRSMGPGLFQNILSHGYTLAPNGELVLRIASGQYQIVSWNGVSFFAAAPVPPEDLGQWVHLAGVYDGTQWHLYRNGTELVASASTVGALSFTAPWAIGARGGGTERFFQGDIAEVRLWRVARTPEQLRDDMRRTLDGNEEGLVGYWPLNEGRSTLARDRSPSEAHGVLRGPTWSVPSGGTEGQTSSR